MTANNKYVPHIVTTDHQSPITTKTTTNEGGMPTTHNAPRLVRSHSITHPTTRSRSTSQLNPVLSNPPVSNTTNAREGAAKDTDHKESKYKRPYSYSVSSVNSNTSDLDLDDAYVNKNRKMMNDVDLENQLIITAGGKREYVFLFFLKLCILMGLVLGSGILIFYAL